MPRSSFMSSTKLSLELSVTLLSADHLFWARSSNLVFTYYQEACLCMVLPVTRPRPRLGFVQPYKPETVLWACRRFR